MHSSSSANRRLMCILAAVALCALLVPTRTGLGQLPAPLAPVDDENTDYERRATLFLSLREMVDALNGDITLLTEDIFSPKALEHVSIGDMQFQFERRFRDSGGFDFLGQNEIDETHMRAWLRTRGGRMPGRDFNLIVEVELDPPFRITNVTLEPVDRVNALNLRTWVDLDRALDEKEYVSALSVWEVAPGGGQLLPIHQRNADQRMSIGPAASLFLLEELVERISAGDAAWDHEHAIDDLHRSFPIVGIGLRPAHEMVSLHELARSMMVSADATAFDHLLDLLGREGPTRRMWASVGRTDDELNQLPPFLFTLEHYKLKCQPEVRILHEFAQADAPQQWAMLEQDVQEMRVFLDLFNAWTVPRDPESLGWFSSADGLARTMAHLWETSRQQDMQVLDQIMVAPRRIPWDRRIWKQYWFELNGEPGGMAGVWALKRAGDGREFIMAIVLNSEKLPLAREFGSDEILSAVELLKNHR